MKKAAVILFATFLFTLLSISTAVAAAPPTEIPRAQTEPTIDGVFNSDEWQSAWHYQLDAKNPPHVQIAPAMSSEYYPTYDFYTMWDEENFYLAVVCKGDITPTPKKMESGMDTRDTAIRGDGFQLYINPTGDYTQTKGKDTDITTYGAGYFWGDFYCEYADNVTPFTWAYDPFDGDVLDAMPDVVKGWIIDSSRRGDTWTIEIKAPWLVINGTADGGNDQWNMSYPKKAGDKVIYEFHTLDYEGTASGQTRYGMSGGRVSNNLDNWLQFTLVDTPAGAAPIIEIEVNTPAEVSDSTPAAPATVTPKAPDTTVSPATSDITYTLVVLALTSAIIAGLAVIEIKFRRNRADYK